MKRFWPIGIFTAAGLAAGVAITFFWSPQYTSNARLVLRAAPVPERLIPPVVTLDLDSTLRGQVQTALARARLRMLIESLDLFPSLRARVPNEDVVKHFRNQIHIAAEPPNMVNVSFTYDDPGKAQRVVSEIAASLMAESIQEHALAIRGTAEFLKDRVEEAEKRWWTLSEVVKQGKADERLLFQRDFARKRYEELMSKLDQIDIAKKLAERRMVPVLEALDPAALPEEPDLGRAPVIVLATIIGLMAGVTAQFAYQHRTRRAPEPAPAA